MSETNEQAPLGSLLTALGAPGQLAVVFDGMVPHAPDEIKAETVAVRDALKQIQQNLGDGASDPAGAITKNLLTVAGSSPSFKAVDDYLNRYCPVGSPIALQYGASIPPPTPRVSSAPSVSNKPDDTSPAVGTQLASVSGSGGYSVATSGSGFAIIKSLLDFSNPALADQSTVTTFDAAGHQLTTIASGSFTGDCAAADVKTVGGRRIILTELISHADAKGVEAETYSVSLDAWDATSGSKLWSAKVVPPQQNPVSCDVHNGQGGRLEGFGATMDGRWGIYQGGAGSTRSQLIDLHSGKVVYKDTADLRVLGNYFVGALYQYNDAPPTVVLQPPKMTGVGKLREINPSGSLYAVERRGPGTSMDGSIILGADGGSLFSEHDASRPDASGTERITQWQMVSYRLPSGVVTWRTPKGQRLSAVAAAGGVLITAYGDERLEGVEEANGKRIWTLPYGTVCGATGRQFMLQLKGQVAIIDIRTGKQLSYFEGDCPDIRAGGIAVTEGDITPGVDHGITVTQALLP